jgi:hypothetical protein
MIHKYSKGKDCPPHYLLDIKTPNNPKAMGFEQFTMDKNRFCALQSNVRTQQMNEYVSTPETQPNRYILEAIF